MRTTIVLSAIVVVFFTYVIWSDTNDSIELQKRIAESGESEAHMMDTHDTAGRVDELREELRILKKGREDSEMITMIAVVLGGATLIFTVAVVVLLRVARL